MHRWLASALSALAAAGCGGGGEAPPRASSPGACPYGAARELTPARDGVVLGCGRAPDGTRVELVATDGSCLMLRGLPGGDRGCGVAPSGREPETTQALGGGVFVQRSPRRRIELYGEASGEVRRVLVRYRAGRRLRRRTATLIAARDGSALRAAGIRRPFGYFVAFVPAGARDVVAHGHDGTRRIGSLRFEPILRSLHPRVFILRPVRSAGS